MYRLCSSRQAINGLKSPNHETTKAICSQLNDRREGKGHIATGEERVKTLDRQIRGVDSRMEAQISGQSTLDRME